MAGTQKIEREKRQKNGDDYTQKNKLPSESYRYASMAFTSNNNKSAIILYPMD